MPHRAAVPIMGAGCGLTGYWGRKVGHGVVNVNWRVHTKLVSVTLVGAKSSNIIYMYSHYTAPTMKLLLAY